MHGMCAWVFYRLVISCSSVYKYPIKTAGSVSTFFLQHRPIYCPSYIAFSISLLPYYFPAFFQNGLSLSLPLSFTSLSLPWTINISFPFPLSHGHGLMKQLLFTMHCIFLFYIFVRINHYLKKCNILYNLQRHFQKDCPIIVPLVTFM